MIKRKEGSLVSEPEGLFVNNREQMMRSRRRTLVQNLLTRDQKYLATNSGRNDCKITDPKKHS